MQAIRQAHYQEPALLDRVGSQFVWLCMRGLFLLFVSTLDTSSHWQRRSGITSICARGSSGVSFVQPWVFLFILGLPFLPFLPFTPFQSDKGSHLKKRPISLEDSPRNNAKVGNSHPRDMPHVLMYWLLFVVPWTFPGKGSKFSWLVCYLCAVPRVYICAPGVVWRGARLVLVWGTESCVFSPQFCIRFCMPFVSCVCSFVCVLIIASVGMSPHASLSSLAGKGLASAPTAAHERRGWRYVIQFSR